MKRIPFNIDDIKNSKVGAINAHLFIEPTPKKKKAKYNNEKVEYEGIIFDSRKEYKRYRELLILQKAGLIGLLQMQVSFLLIAKSETERECKYVADFVYIDAKSGAKIVEDVKSEMTRKLPTYIMKRKLMASIHKIQIKEV